LLVNQSIGRDDPTLPFLGLGASKPDLFWIRNSWMAFIPVNRVKLRRIELSSVGTTFVGSVRSGLADEHRGDRRRHRLGSLTPLNLSAADDPGEGELASELGVAKTTFFNHFRRPESKLLTAD